MAILKFFTLWPENGHRTLDNGQRTQCDFTFCPMLLCSALDREKYVYGTNETGALRHCPLRMFSSFITYPSHNFSKPRKQRNKTQNKTFSSGARRMYVALNYIVLCYSQKRYWSFVMQQNR